MDMRSPVLTVPPRPVPRGRPAPTAQCGHAVAFAGWRPDETGVRDVLLVCDPGDNSRENVRHVWESKPRELPVHFGRQRPAVVLQPAGTFTITGAVVVAPQKVAIGAARMTETLAPGMPDLTQDFSSRWPGLCAPTSAADVLFSLREKDEKLRSSLVLGPNAKADEGVTRLISGGLERISPTSLAGRMGVGQEGMGATNDGMRQGLAAWLDYVSPGSWNAELDWFDDAASDRRRAEQRAFFGRLAAAVDAGGGAIICLWPGSEFSENSVGPSDPQVSEQATGRESSDSAAPGAPAQARGDLPTLPEATFPEIPPLEQPPGGLPGRSAPLDPAAAVSQAEKKMEQARGRLDGGRAEAALELATEAVSLLHEASRQDPSARARLATAIALCRECDGRMPPRRRLDPGKPTEFE